METTTTKQRIIESTPDTESYCKVDVHSHDFGRWSPLFVADFRFTNLLQAGSRLLVDGLQHESFFQVVSGLVLSVELNEDLAHSNSILAQSPPDSRKYS